MALTEQELYDLVETTIKDNGADNPALTKGAEHRILENSIIEALFANNLFVLTGDSSIRSRFTADAESLVDYAFYGGFDSAAIGVYSFSWGLNNLSEAEGSVTFGQSCNASGEYAFAGGTLSIASGNLSYAYGNQSEASGLSSYAINGGEASGEASAAFTGIASGDASVSFGGEASGDNSIAFLGIASGNYSFTGGQDYIDASVPRVPANDRLIISSGLGAFNYSNNTSAQTLNHGARASYSGIVGGINGDIDPASTGCVLLASNASKVPSGITYTVLAPKFESLTAGEGWVLKSPGGTRYKVTVTDIGVLVVAPA